MTVQNQFKPFATGDGAVALPAASWSALVSLIAQGFQEGIVPPEEFNTVMRGPTSMAAMVGQFINNRAGDDALDNGDIATLLASFEKALLGFLQPFGVYFIADTGTANHIVGTSSYPPASYSATRLIIVRKAAVANSGDVTANFWGLGDVPVTDNTGANFAAAGLKASAYYALVPDGAGFRVIGGATSYTNVTNLTANSGDMIAVGVDGVVDFRTNRGTHVTDPAALSDNDRLPFGRASDDHGMFQTRAEFVAWLKGKFPDALAPLSYNPTANRYEIAQASTSAVGVVRRATKAEILARATAVGQPTGFVAADDLPGGSGIMVGSIVRAPGAVVAIGYVGTLLGREITGEKFLTAQTVAGAFYVGPCMPQGNEFYASNGPGAWWWDSRRDLFNNKQTWTLRRVLFWSFPTSPMFDGSVYKLCELEFECTAITP